MATNNSGEYRHVCLLLYYIHVGIFMLGSVIAGFTSGLCRWTGNTPSASQAHYTPPQSGPYGRAAEGYRAHPLFDHIAITLAKFQHTLNILQHDVASIKEVQEELKALTQSQQKRAYNLKSEGLDEVDSVACGTVHCY